MARKTKPEITESPAPSSGKPAAKGPEIKITKTVGTVLVANQHMGGITLPRKGPGGISMKPLRFAPGTVTQVDAEEWAKYKATQMVQHYLDAGLIVEVKKAQAVPVLSDHTSEPEIPDNLKTEAELTQGDTAAAKVIREKTGSVNIG